MSEPVIIVSERFEKPNKVRKQGFIPGVVYGKDIKSTSIKLNQKEYKKLLHGPAKNAKARIKLGNEEKNCIIKEVQKDCINGQILHVELQTIQSDDIIRLKVPIVFQGKEKLTFRKLLVQELVPEIELRGKAADIPEFISIDVGDKNAGDRITVSDIQLGDGIKIIYDENETLAVIIAIKEHSDSDDSCESTDVTNSTDSNDSEVSQ